MDHSEDCSVSHLNMLLWGEAAADSFPESRTNDVIESTSFHTERSESKLVVKHRSFPLQSKAHPIGKHQFSHSNPRARSRRRQNFLNHEVTAHPGPWITVKTAPSPTSTCFSGSLQRLLPEKHVEVGEGAVFTVIHGPG